MANYKRKCICCGDWFDPNDDAETHNGGIYGESVCFECYNAGKEGCFNCELAECGMDDEGLPNDKVIRGTR